MFRSNDWSSLADDWMAWESVWWGFDPPAIVERPSTAKNGVRHFRDAGVTVIREGRDYLLVTNGIVGTAGFGNHKHNDLLAFEYHAAGAALIVDPGSFVYTADPDARNLMRSTRSHNTLTIDAEEQNEVRPEWLFRMFEKAAPEVLEIVERDDVVQYRGRHRGYARLAEPVVHERTFTVERATGAITIVDRLDGRGVHHLRWHFHFAPGVDVTMPQPGIFDIRRDTVFRRLTGPAELRPVIAPAWYSPSYGVRLPCMALDLDVTASLDGHKEYAFTLRA
jgi:hypothetical protein